MKSKDYFDKEYGKKHIKTIVEMDDLESLYGLIDEFSEISMYSLVDNFIDKLAKSYSVPKNSIYIKQGFDSLRFYSDQLYDGSPSEQLLQVVEKSS